MLAKYFRLTFEVVKLNILSAMEYRVSFFTQVFGMALNDLLLIIMWLVFFSKFPDLHGWQMNDTMLLFAVAMTNFGIYRVIAGNTEEISHVITMGELDYFLTLPKNVLWQVTTAQSNISALGDFLFGIVMFFILIHAWSKILLFMLLSIITAMILYNVIVILQSLGFYFGNFEETAERIFHIILGLSLYPATTFSGVLKFLTFTIIPVFFITWIPVDLIKFFQWHYLFYLLGFWLLTLGLGLLVFYKGLKRYESGNLINLRM